MATYKQVSYGSQGSDVTELQKLLNNNGYNLDTDGIFGEKTQAAVKDYQNKNGLSVDGIVGTNTWGALTKEPNASAGASEPATATPAATKAPTFTYTESDAVAQANALLQQQLDQKPGQWQGGTWNDDLDNAIKQILNRDKFTYDLNGDMLYQQYKDQYVNQGKLAMMDTMGQAAAMTGGYGNSYAQSVGQQAYQGYLQQLNDVVPELYGMALDRYTQEGQALYDQAALMAQMNDQEYGRYRDQLSDYYTDLNYLTENARYMSETEYQKALDQHKLDVDADETAYNRQQNNKADLINLITATGYKPTAAELAEAGMSADEANAYATYYENQNTTAKTATPAYTEYNATQRNTWRLLFEEATTLNQLQAVKRDMLYAGFDPNLVEDLYDQFAGKITGNTGNNWFDGSNYTGSGNVGSTTVNEYGYDTHGYTTDRIKALQTAAGITADGIWGPKTQEAYEAGYRPGSIDEAVFDGWTPEDWQMYFESIGSVGSTEAIEELRTLMDADLVTTSDLPTWLIPYAMEFMMSPTR